MKSEDKRTVAIHLDETLYKALDELRWAARARSLSNYIEGQLRRLVEPQSKQMAPAEPRPKAVEQPMDDDNLVPS